MSRILTHLTVALLGFAPLTAGAKLLAVGSTSQRAVVACPGDCPSVDCPMPSCCDGSCDRSVSAAGE